jgi:hypothetical protein
MKRGMIIAVFVAATLPLRAGIVLALNPTPTSFGSFAGGLTLNVLATGTALLNGPSGTIVTNPDGSLNNPQPASCTVCWAPGYQYFLPASLGGTPYPQVAGGDGVNHFPGGGGNFDAFPGNLSPWAPEGKHTTDTTDPGAIRFGALAYTFTSNPAGVMADPTTATWLALGNQISTGTGGILLLVVADTFYPNNVGVYDVTISVAPVPEPGAVWLAFSGFALLGLRRFRTRQR